MTAAIPYTTLTSENWDHYAQYRPQYPPKTWISLLAYHGGPLTTIHELGCGSGVGTHGLLQTALTNTNTNPSRRIIDLTHLILSDPGSASIASARALISPLLQRWPEPHAAPKLSVHIGTAEDGLPQSLVAPGTVDLIFACECLHWTDINRTLAAAAAQLRPGGTFASVYYMHVPGIRNNATVEAAFDHFVLTNHQRMVTRSRSTANNMAFSRQQALWGLDFVPLASPEWTDVKRVYMNFKQGQRWTRTPVLEAMMEKGGKASSVTSAVREDEETAEWVEVDEAWERKGCGVEWFKAFLRTLVYTFPDSAAFEGEDWDAFEAALREAGGAVDVYWPATMIMARKK